MTKYRRGSKIVDLVKRRFTHPNEVKNIKQVPDAPPEKNVHPTAVTAAVCTVQPSTSQDQIITVPEEFFATSQDNVAFDIIILQRSISALPSTSGETSSNHNEVQNKPLANCGPVSPTTLLNDDLYLTDSDDEDIPVPDDNISPTSSLNLVKPSPRLPIYNAKKNPINKNKNEHSNITATSDNPDTILETPYISRGNLVSRPKNSKRREAIPNQWKKNVRKNKRLYGEPYLSAKGIMIPGRVLKESKCVGRCLHQCTTKFTEEERLRIFASFWSISSVELKRLYVVSLIERQRTRSLKRNQSRKKLTSKYFLMKVGETDKIRVCQKFFLATLNVSETFVRFCFKKVIDSNMVMGDKRGKHVPHNKKSRDIREDVRNHIRSFPRISPPQARRDTNKEYLSRNLNLIKMYNMYKLKCKRGQKPYVELAYYRSVFKRDFNIAFYRPGRDICDICLAFEKMTRDEREEERYKYNDHLDRINNARQHRNEAQSLAQLGEIHFVEYDLKCFIESPSSRSRAKRAMPLYNFTLLDFNKEKRNVLCFCWHEGIARKGSGEIGSCLYKYLKNIADGKPITLMSDTCASQCRNMYISSLLLYCVETLDIPEINQKYFEQGHCHMETDLIHVNIEKAKKNTAILDASNFYDLIRNCVKTFPNEVTEMNKEDFIDLKYLKNIIVKNAKIDYLGKPVNWLKIRWLQYRKENPNHIYFKYDLDEIQFNRISVIRRGKRTQNCDEIVLLKKFHG